MLETAIVAGAGLILALVLLWPSFTQPVEEKPTEELDSYVVELYGDARHEVRDHRSVQL
jgi:type II secretory pathway component PulM